MKLFKISLIFIRYNHTKTVNRTRVKVPNKKPLINKFNEFFYLNHFLIEIIIVLLYCFQTKFYFVGFSGGAFSHGFARVF